MTQSSDIRSAVAVEWPEIEYDDGYPVDEDFTAFGSDALPLSFEAAGAWLLRELPRAAENMCCACDVITGKSRILGEPAILIHFSTYGWSGAESIMALIERRYDLKHFMESWRRGGHYVFELPFKKVKRQVSEIRKQAWETRRQKYGERGHKGSYAR